MQKNYILITSTKLADSSCICSCLGANFSTFTQDVLRFCMRPCNSLHYVAIPIQNVLFLWLFKKCTRKSTQEHYHGSECSHWFRYTELVTDWFNPYCSSFGIANITMCTLPVEIYSRFSEVNLGVCFNYFSLERAFYI